MPRLATLHPTLTPTVLDTADYTHQLVMDCPSCGPTYPLTICVVLNAPPPGHASVWSLQLPVTPSGDGWDGVTLFPSFQNANHGRKKPCNVHFSIINGEVVPS